MSGILDLSPPSGLLSNVTDTGNLNAADAALSLTPQEKNLYQHHLSNLNGSGAVWHPNGAVSTIYQAVVDGPEGKFYNIPTVWNGKILPVPEAMQQASQAGWNKWPSYGTPEAADARYEDMHKFMEGDVQNMGSGSSGILPNAL